MEGTRNKRRPRNKVLATVNRTHLTAEQIAQLADEVHKMKEEDRDFEGVSICSVTLFNNADIAMSAYFRVNALARIVLEGLPGWCQEQKPDGSITTHWAILEAAGQAPLRQKDNALVFSRTSFLRKAFQIAKTIR